MVAAGVYADGIALGVDLPNFFFVFSSLICTVPAVQFA
jgi:hypothetical protein